MPATHLLSKKEIYEITVDNIIPPYKDYDYFKNGDQLPFRHQTDSFDMVNAWWLIEASTLVYSEPEFVTETFCKKAGFAEVKYFAAQTTQCFVASNDQFAVVAFRGSEGRLREGDSDPGYILADWLTNFNFLPEPWEQGGMVHRGFKTALSEVWAPLENHINSLLAKNLKIWITGHSLGAALATLAADRIGNAAGVYTFGSPRVGDQEFKNQYKANTYRFVNNSDIVTRVPPSSMYCHVGEFKHIDSAGIIRDRAEQPEKIGGDFQGEFRNIFNTLGQNIKSFTETLFDPLTDHVPTFYAIHIWNNIPETG